MRLAKDQLTIKTKTKQLQGGKNVSCSPGITINVEFMFGVNVSSDVGNFYDYHSTTPKDVAQQYLRTSVNSPAKGQPQGCALAVPWVHRVPTFVFRRLEKRTFLTFHGWKPLRSLWLSKSTALNPRNLHCTWVSNFWLGIEHFTAWVLGSL